MSDLLIHRHRDLAVITANSEEGKNWLISNLTTSSPHSVVIQVEFLEDWLKELYKDGIEFDEV